ncbi:MAG TPA: 23S rRNA (guanosine(2251)-2'-O)-methyltransferase RlmB, partial [Galbitalea sp.]|nr:23S rRNA (guanosine(2251)-2'-O)-methyltransferase RlmB [Galbitalea sp.]
MKNTEGERKGRPGAVRHGSKGKQVGSGGQGRQALEGKKPTPKAEDRPYHPAGKRKAAAERYEAAGGRA